MSRLLCLLLLAMVSSMHRQAMHHQLLQLIFLSFSPALQLGGAGSIETSLPLGQELPQIIDIAKREKQTLSKSEYKSPIIKQSHHHSGEVNIIC